MKQDLIEEYEDNGMLRLRRMYPILIADSYEDGLEEAIFDVLNWKAKRCDEFFGREGIHKAYNKYIREDEPTSHDLTCNLMDGLTRRKPGHIIAEVSTPVREYRDDFFSWGYYTSSWVIGADMDDLMRKALDWCESMRPKKMRPKNKPQFERKRKTRKAAKP